MRFLVILKSKELAGRILLNSGFPVSSVDLGGCLTYPFSSREDRVLIQIREVPES